MAITTYIENGKKLYEVYVNGFDARGIRIQRRKRAIDTQRKAEVTEFEFKRELARLKEERVQFRWIEWYAECLKRMKVVHRPSTIWGYEKLLGHWINPLWSNREIDTITRSDIHEAIFEKVGEHLSPNSRKTILKQVRRIFEMAVEEGVLSRNPCTGVQVKVPEVEQKVLTNSEVEILLREARLTDHRFFPMWAMALMTGMRDVFISIAVSQTRPRAFSSWIQLSLDPRRSITESPEVFIWVCSAKQLSQRTVQIFTQSILRQ